TFAMTRRCRGRDTTSTLEAPSLTGLTSPEWFSEQESWTSSERNSLESQLHRRPARKWRGQFRRFGILRSKSRLRVREGFQRRSRLFWSRVFQELSAFRLCGV